MICDQNGTELHAGAIVKTTEYMSCHNDGTICLVLSFKETLPFRRDEFIALVLFEDGVCSYIWPQFCEIL